MQEVRFSRELSEHFLRNEIREALGPKAWDAKDLAAALLLALDGEVPEEREEAFNPAALLAQFCGFEDPALPEERVHDIARGLQMALMSWTPNALIRGVLQVIAEGRQDD